jgi:hypothetical protein
MTSEVGKAEETGENLAQTLQTASKKLFLQLGTQLVCLGWGGGGTG